MNPLTESEKSLLNQMLTSHAYRERLAAFRFSDACEIAPSIMDRDYIKQVSEEEHGHYRGCIAVAKELNLPVEEAVIKRMQRSPPGIPSFDDWLDVLFAHAFNDQAGYFVLNGVKGSKVSAYARLASNIVAEEEAHGTEGAEMLVKYYPSAPNSENEKRAKLLVHLDAAVRCLGRPDSTGDRLALESGLKTVPSAETIRAFCAYADNVLIRIGCPDLTRLSSRYLQSKGTNQSTNDMNRKKKPSHEGWEYEY